MIWNHLEAAPHLVFVSLDESKSQKRKTCCAKLLILSSLYIYIYLYISKSRLFINHINDVYVYVYVLYKVILNMPKCICPKTKKQTNGKVKQLDPKFKYCLHM